MLLFARQFISVHLSHVVKTWFIDLCEWTSFCFRINMTFANHHPMIDLIPYYKITWVVKAVLTKNKYGITLDVVWLSLLDLTTSLEHLITTYESAQYTSMSLLSGSIRFMAYFCLMSLIFFVNFNRSLHKNERFVVVKYIFVFIQHVTNRYQLNGYKLLFIILLSLVYQLKFIV